VRKLRDEQVVPVRVPACETGVRPPLLTAAARVPLVGAARTGTWRIPCGFLKRWPHSVAGAVLALSGVVMLAGS
jgi:hypothetical protein